MNTTSVSDADSSHWGELLSARYIFATVTISLGIVLFAFNAFLVSTALPSAVLSFGGAELMSWSTSLYLILSIVGGAGTATLTHMIGTRKLFGFSALIFLIGTLAAGLALSMPMLLAGRACQGLAAGVIEAGCYMLIPRLFPSRLIPKVFGVEAIAWAVAAFGGPLLAGYLAVAISWRAAFLAAVPMIVVFALLVPVVIGRSNELDAAKPVPWGKLGAVAVGMLFVTLASIADSNLAKFCILVVAAAMFWITIGFDGRSKPMLFPAKAFRLTSAAGLGHWTALLMPMAQASESVFLIYALQYLWNYSALEGGLVASVMALSWSASQFILASMGTAQVRRTMIWVGPAILVVGLGMVVLALPLQSLSLMLLAQLLVGSAFGLNWSSLSQTMMEAASENERDASSALMPTIQAAGYGIGAALFGVVGNAMHYSTASAGDLMADMVLLFLFAAGLALAAVAAAFAMVRILRKDEVSVFA